MVILPIRKPFFRSLLFITIFILLFNHFEASRPRKRDYQKNYYYAIELEENSQISPREVAVLLKISYEGQIGALDNHYLFSSSKEMTHLFTRSLNSDFDLSGENNDRVLLEYRSLKEKRKQSPSSLEKRSYEIIDKIVSVEKQKLKKRHKRVPPPIPKPKNKDNNDPDDIGAAYGIHDPGFKYQWHLINPLQTDHHINVTGVWKEGITGKGVIAAIVDDGLDLDSEDLKDNFFAAGSYDFNDHTPLPKPRLVDDNHGTRCAGEIAAVKNDVCGVGVAPDAKVAGIRILSGEISDVDEAEALNYGFQENHIYSCSWGPPDDGQSAEAPKGLILKAMLKGIKDGRGGKGSLFVFASGNGGANDDNCNFDGYTNSLYTITVGAVDRLFAHPYYAEKCSALLVTTYSSGSGSYIYTTDIGPHNCTSLHGGTSAAAPIAAGVYALVLQIRPDLTWRDMQYLQLMSAVPFNLKEPEWDRNAAGRLFSHKYGYGLLDAYRIVQNAKIFKNLGPQVFLEMPIIKVNKQIPMDTKGIVNSVQVTQSELDDAKFGRLEHVTVTVNIQHTRRGDILVDLISPNGIISHLGTPRMYDEHRGGLSNWTFMSVKHWDENPVGKWTIQVKDTQNPEFWGTFNDWRIKFWGEQKNLTGTLATTTDDSVKTTETTSSEATITESPKGHKTTTTSATEEASSSNKENINSLEDESSKSNTWIIAILVMGFAFIFAGLAYFTKKHFWDANGRYEFSALQSSDATNIGEDSIPLTRGNKQFMTSRELFDAFGDSSDEEEETTQVVFENSYMDKYMNEDEKVESETINEKNIDDGDNAGGSGGEDLRQGESINNRS
ncbi:peptidase S8/S53 domain-containing protein [Glomus cerebriforme]|uniref:Peptidase S8/S53 domain-containing protein n=1 Tax=Glomus cerebriforme TaxID=658196 RepID=A0A397SIK8_9GLOM|nr:peptidase S8/S53 domain-containing protein [Glomus cerebriforme]